MGLLAFSILLGTGLTWGLFDWFNGSSDDDNSPASPDHGTDLRTPDAPSDPAPTPSDPNEPTTTPPPTCSVENFAAGPAVGGGEFTIDEGKAVIGTNGDDLAVFFGSGDFDGGDGNDLIHASTFGDTDGTVQNITGGAGKDAFYIDTYEHGADTMTVIKDFTKGQDQLILSDSALGRDVTGSGDIPTSIEINKDDDAAFTDVVFTSQGTDGEPLVHTIRLEGITELADSDISTGQKVHGDTDCDGIGTISKLTLGNDGDNNMHSSTSLLTGDADDTIDLNYAYAGNIITNGGDDSFSGHGSNLSIHAGAGDDVFTHIGKKVEIDGASGNDTISFNLTDTVTGGEGDDSLTLDVDSLNVIGTDATTAEITDLAANDTLNIEIDDSIKGDVYFERVGTIAAMNGASVNYDLNVFVVPKGANFDPNAANAVKIAQLDLGTNHNVNVGQGYHAGFPDLSNISVNKSVTGTLDTLVDPGADS